MFNLTIQNTIPLCAVDTFLQDSNIDAPITNVTKTSFDVIGLSNLEIMKLHVFVKLRDEVNNERI